MNERNPLLQALSNRGSWALLFLALGFGYVGLLLLYAALHALLVWLF